MRNQSVLLGVRTLRVVKREGSLRKKIAKRKREDERREKSSTEKERNS